MARNSFFLRQWREFEGLTQEQLAERLDTTGATVSRWENGRMNFPSERLDAIAKALGIEIGDLFRDPNKPETELWRAVLQLPPEQRSQALRILKALTGGAGE